MYTKSVALLAVLAGSVGWSGDALHLKSGVVRTAGLWRRAGEQLPDPGRRLATGRSRVIVQYARAPGVAESAILQAIGGTVLGPVPEDAWMVVFPDGAAVQVLYPAVRFMGRLEPRDKVSSLVRNEGWMIVEFFADVTADEGAEILQRTAIRQEPTAGLLLRQKVVWGGLAEAAALAEWNEVAYVFPAAARGGQACQSGKTGQYVSSAASSWARAGVVGATVGYFVEPLADTVSGGDVQNALNAAFKEWSRYAVLDFVAASTNLDLRTINVKFATGDHGDGYPFDGPGGVLAHTFYPAPLVAEPLAGDMHLDLAETWTADDLYSVMLHELGHGLGLVHADNPAAVMYPIYRRTNGLGALDISAIRDLYGLRSVPEESVDQDLVVEVTDVLRNVVEFPPGELVAIQGKARGGPALSVRWRYLGGNDWTAAPGSFAWVAPMVPLFGSDVDVVIEVSDGQGRVALQTLHIPLTAP